MHQDKNYTNSNFVYIPVMLSIGIGNSIFRTRNINIMHAIATYRHIGVGGRGT